MPVDVRSLVHLVDVDLREGLAGGESVDVVVSDDAVAQVDLADPGVEQGFELRGSQATSFHENYA